jgi:hypothetical protein
VIPRHQANTGLVGDPGDREIGKTRVHRGGAETRRNQEIETGELMKKHSAVSTVVAVAMLSVCGFAFQGGSAQPQQNKVATQERAPAKAPQKAQAKATAPIQTFMGVISDGQCAAKGSHKEIMNKARVNTAANCVRGCARRYGYVLYDPATKKIYKLNDQERPAELAGKRAKIKGALNKETQTIFVSSIEPGI